MLTNPNILIVEDDPDHLAIVEHYLAKCGDRIGETRSVGTLAAAREELAGGGFHVALLDLTLPASSLEQTVDRIPELLAYGVAIVALSSLDAPDLAERVLASGAASFLAKRRIDEASLRSALDECRYAGSSAVAAAPRPGVSARGSATAPNRAGELASRLAHDTNSWLANLSFRIDLLGSDPGIAASDTASAHLASMRTSLDAATEYVLACRELVVDGAAAVDLQPTALEERARGLHRTWSERKARRDVALDAGELPDVLADARGLGTLLEALIDNVAVHWTSPGSDPSAPESGSGPDPTMRLRRAPSDGRRVTIEITDNGGPWSVPGADRLGDPFAPAMAEHPGLGLYRVVRWMERMNGSATFLERSDAPGCFAVRLSFVPA